MNNEIYLAYAIGTAYLFAVYKLAIYKNRSPWIWLALCFIFTPVLFLMYLKGSKTYEFLLKFIFKKAKELKLIIE